MSHRSLIYLFFVFIFGGGVSALIDHPAATPHQEYHNFDKTSFAYLYKFEDGSIVSETGAFKINENTVTVFGQGHMRFEMRKKLYDFDFNVAENGVRATLTFDIDGGLKIEEKFDLPFNTKTVSSRPVSGDFDISRNVIYPDDDSAFARADVNIRFPANQYHPSFGCSFNGQANSWSSFSCETFENRTEEIIDDTRNTPDPQWVIDHRRSLISTLDFENYHDAQGNYKINYVFDTGVAITEFGKLNADNSVSSIEGLISFNSSREKFYFNYKANSTTYDVALTLNSGDEGTADKNEQSYQLASGQQLDRTSKRESYSNSEVYTYFNVQRELTLVDGKTFARASFSLSFANPNSGFEIFQVEIDINEIHPFGEQGSQYPGAPLSVYISMVG